MQQYEIGDARVANENQAAIKTAPTPQKKKQMQGANIWQIQDTQGMAMDGEGIVRKPNEIETER